MVIFSVEKKWVVGIFTFLISIFLTINVIWHFEKMHLHEVHDKINDIAQENGNLLQKNIDHKLALTYPLAAMIAEVGTVHDFESIGKKLITFYPNISEIALVPNGIIKQVVPLSGNEKALGFNLFTDPEQKNEALLARETGKLTLAGPLNLVQGGEGIVGRLPVFTKEKKFWGFVLIVIRFPDILSTTTLGNLKKEGYQYTLTRIHPLTKKEQIIASSGREKLYHPAQQTIDLPNTTWTLRIAPIEGRHSTWLLAIKMLIALLVSALLGYVAKQYVELKSYRHSLEKLVKQRTIEITETKNQLHTLLNIIPDLIWLKDKDGVYLLCNPMFERFFGAKEEEIVGKTDYDFVNKELADFFRKNDRIAMEANSPTINEEWITFADDGHRALLETTKIPMYNDEHLLIGILGVAHDITQRHNAEVHLIRTEKLLEEMSAAAHIGGWEININSGIGIWTKEASLIYDMDPTERVTLETGLSVYDGEWLKKIQTALDEAITKKKGCILELQMTTQKGNQKWVRLTGSPILEKGETTLIKGSIQDITAQKLTEEKVHWLAHYDPLTGLPNRTLLHDHVDYAIKIAYRTKAPLALLYLDLDHFKNINDTLGHIIGDELLIHVAQRIQSVIRESDTLSRQGGDEFMLLLTGVDANGAAHTAEKIIDVISQPYTIQHHELTVTPSIGIALYPMDGSNLTTLSQCADGAMYRAKHDGRNCYRFFTPEIQARSARNLELENALRYALKRNELEVYYQPQISMESGKIIGAEALLRWNHPTMGMISPAEFIPIAEESGQIITIGEWVLRRALGQLKLWIAEGMEPFIMAVNLSAIQFRHPKLVSLVLSVLEELQLPPEYLELELTEGITMENPLHAIDIMNELHSHGIRMSIDDFGTGYSSLNYLKKFRVYKLKIDQSFIHDITENPEDRVIVNTIINMAHNLNLITIAEGVETAEQLAILRESGCNEIQGYYFSRPLPAIEFELYLRDAVTLHHE
ncbi:MAG: EAL domain-containing protein [Campylobacterales bacterium]|nr:EAL domain-containing protein [Campylobacterales bacterium]